MMPYGEYAEYPNCGKIAHGEEEIEELFGYRNMGDEKIIPQSWFRSLGAKNVGVIVKSLTKVLMVQKNFFCTIRLILNTLYMII